MSRLVVGACSSCGRELRAKAHAIREEMHLTCRCGVSQRVTSTPDARRAAAEALDTRALRVPREIRAIARDIDSQRAIATAFALVHDLGEEARHRLIAMLGNVLSGTETGDPSTAVLVLGDFGGSEAIASLSRALDHWNPVVRTHAAAALSRMGEAGERALTNYANGRRDVVGTPMPPGVSVNPLPPRPPTPPRVAPAPMRGWNWPSFTDTTTAPLKDLLLGVFVAPAFCGLFVFMTEEYLSAGNWVVPAFLAPVWAASAFGSIMVTGAVFGAMTHKFRSRVLGGAIGVLCALIPSAIVGTAAWFTYHPYLVGTVTSRTPAVEVRARPGRPAPGMPLELFVRVQCPSMCAINTITMSRRADTPGVLVYQGGELPTSTASLNVSGARTVRAAFGLIPPRQFDPRDVRLDITYEYATDSSVWRRYGSRRANIVVPAFGSIDQ